MEQGFGLGDAIACGIVLLAFCGTLSLSVLAWRCLRQKPRTKHGMIYVIGPKGDVKTLASTDAAADMLRVMAAIQAN